MPAQKGSKVGPCTGKKFLVTGAARGIGKALVAELYAQGATTIYALARNPDGLKALQEEFPGVQTIAVDISDWDATRKALENVEPVDCLINNAGVFDFCSFWKITPEYFDTLYKTNLKAIVNISQVVAKKMISRGTGGAIVNVSSLAGRKVFPMVLGYGALKAGLEMLSKGMALELAPHKITVNSVCPAGVQTEGVASMMAKVDTTDPEIIKMMEQETTKVPTGEQFVPMCDVVNTILFFGANVTSQITGESLLVDGGLKIAF